MALDDYREVGQPDDVDIDAQTLARILAALELDDGTGTYAEIERRGTDLQMSLEQHQTALLESGDQPLDVSGADVPVVSGASALDVTAARVPVGKSYTRKSHDASQTGSVAAGNNEVANVTSPSGTIWLLQNLRVRVASDSQASSGTHSVELEPANLAAVHYFRADSNHSSSVNVQAFSFKKADSNKDPSTDAALAQALSGVVIDDTDGLDFVYRNNTDAAQENNRTYELDVLEVPTA